jgi:hypothetical protein
VSTPACVPFQDRLLSFPYGQPGGLSASAARARSEPYFTTIVAGLCAPSGLFFDGLVLKSRFYRSPSKLTPSEVWAREPSQTCVGDWCSFVPSTIQRFVSGNKHSRSPSADALCDARQGAPPQDAAVCAWRASHLRRRPSCLRGVTWDWGYENTNCARLLVNQSSGAKAITIATSPRFKHQ